MGKWDKGHVCDICHQVHRQIIPACMERRRQRDYAQSEEGQRAMREAMERLVARMKAEGVFPFNRPAQEVK